MPYGFNEDKSKANIASEERTFKASSYNSASALLADVYNFINGHLYNASATWSDAGIYNWGSARLELDTNSSRIESVIIDHVEIDSNGVAITSGLIYGTGSYLKRTYTRWNTDGGITATLSTKSFVNSGLEIKIRRF